MCYFYTKLQLKEALLTLSEENKLQNPCGTRVSWNIFDDAQKKNKSLQDSFTCKMGWS